MTSMTYSHQAWEVLEAARVSISNIKPSDWAEKNVIMSGSIPGPLRYDRTTPYTREIIDCFASDHPAREIAVMGSAQFGKTASVIIPAIGYLIANDPGNIIMTVGHEDLMEDAMQRVDFMLDSTGLRKSIRSSANRARNTKSGDTNSIKEFPNGYFKLSGASNPKIWRQSSYKYGFIDDYDAVKSASKEAGSVRDLITKRFTTFHETRKILYMSSPELEQTSNILEVYLLGDQRKFMVPCPCCGEYIELLWSTTGPDDAPAGITWQLDDSGKLIEDTVGYTCQKCLGFFTDQKKIEYVSKGFWRPTATPFRPDFVSYHMSCLYSPAGMSDWLHYVYKYLECNPPGKPRIESKYQTFLNLDLGLPYRASGEAPKANDLQKNIRNYEIGTIPESISEKDGNGKIVLLTCACDLNGIVEDARLDYEIVGWSESGSSYSIAHGSIGTFVPREGAKKIKEDRARWTYEHNAPNSVWREMDKVLSEKYKTDTGRSMRILMAAIDTGHYTEQAYYYIDTANGRLPTCRVTGFKGDKSKFIRLSADLPTFKPAKERPNLYIIEVNAVKDDLASLIKLRRQDGELQPPGFMNFPIPSDGKYLLTNYFSHYEAEHRVLSAKSLLGR
jgi:phage terminase large subunit GpA-like protein